MAYKDRKDFEVTSLAAAAEAASHIKKGNADGGAFMSAKAASPFILISRYCINGNGPDSIQTKG